MFSANLDFGLPNKFIAGEANFYDMQHLLDFRKLKCLPSFYLLADYYTCGWTSYQGFWGSQNMGTKIDELGEHSDYKSSFRSDQGRSSKRSFGSRKFRPKIRESEDDWELPMDYLWYLGFDAILLFSPFPYSFFHVDTSIDGQSSTLLSLNSHAFFCFFFQVSLFPLFLSHRKSELLTVAVIV